jgi:hypothetical protein
MTKRQNGEAPRIRGLTIDDLTKLRVAIQTKVPDEKPTLMNLRRWVGRLSALSARADRLKFEDATPRTNRGKRS